MEDNTEKTIAKEQGMCFDEFVDSLFDFARDSKKAGLSIQMADGYATRIEVIHVDGMVRIKMDDVDMGYFEKYDRQGYKCRFNQKNRDHIREGHTKNEAMMESICNHPLVLLQKAY